MFDLKNIEFIKTDMEHGRKAYSFVGLKRKENSDRLEFWLPLGFDSFDTDINNPESFNRVKRFFFKMYRTFQVYRERRLNQLTEEEKTKDRDGVFEFENGFSFVNKNDEQVVFYGKLNALDKILEGYDELRISSLEKKQVRSHEIDYSKIHKYMHQAIYLDDDVIYLDEMNIAKNVLMHESPPILQLFCFIYTEIKNELEEFDSIPNKAIELSNIFKNNYLQPDNSLFAQDTFLDTINTLKNVFEEIDTKTTYKDEDYWHFYDAIEAFLMSEREENSSDGIYFGINHFYDIWEDMCQEYILSSENPYRQYILFVDIKGELLTRKELELKNELDVNPFLMTINSDPFFRKLRPDLVLSEHINLMEGNIYSYTKLAYPKMNNNKQQREDTFKVTLEDLTKFFTDADKHIYKPIINMRNSLLTEEADYYNSQKKHKFMFIDDFNDFKVFVKKWLQGLYTKNVTIIDYKYMRQSDYEKYSPDTIDEKGENKIKLDIHKQLVYEWAVQKNFENSETESEFWIPHYSDSSDFEKSKLDITAQASSEFQKSKVKLKKINFKVLQEHYIKK